MYYCGIDVASKSSVFCVRDRRGKIVQEGPVETDGKAFEKHLKQYPAKQLSVVLEAGNQSWWLSQFLKQRCAKVVVAPAQKIDAIARGKRKTDKLDARKLSELLRVDGLPTPVHVPSQGGWELRGLLNARRKLVGMRTALSNLVRSVLKQEGVKLKLGALKSRRGWENLKTLSVKSAHVALIVESVSGVVLALMDSIWELECELKKRAAADERVRRLRTMPCVGLISSLTLVSALDDVSRFKTTRQVQSYSGLIPMLRQSGERRQSGPITREGRRELRAVWVEIAHLMARDKRATTLKLRRWFENVGKRRGKRTAIIGLARKILGIAYLMLREKQDFDPGKLKAA